MTKLGSTGTFPHGRLGPHDEGGLKFEVGHDPDGNVHINFGKRIAWLAMPREQIADFIKVLAKHAGFKKVEIEL